MTRREFLGQSLNLLGFSLLPDVGAALSPAPQTTASGNTASSRILFETSDTQYMATYNRALRVLARNIANVATFGPVLMEGSMYGGVWLECAPHEGLLYTAIRRDVARNNHAAFFAAQRDDGQLPCWLRTTGAGFGQIQMVVPIAATAWELAQQTGDSDLLETAYGSCSRWDLWLRRYRDTRKTGLCEGFCTYDTGQDNSPRWAGIPNRCPDGDARKCPSIASLPRLCPDLSATVYGGRIALAAMARALGKNGETDRWLADAEAIRTAMIQKLYCPEDAAFYDLDAQNHFVRVRSDVISRVLGEHVVDHQLFETIYPREIHNPKAFWAPYPLPSIALDDSTFVRPIPRNSWGGASQALTAMRAPRWIEHYGKPADLGHLMEQWIKAILRQQSFLQQLDPLTGAFTPDQDNYSPTALVFIDFTWRRAGVRQEGESLEWNIRPPDRNLRSNYRLELTRGGTAEIKYNHGRAELLLRNKPICHTSDLVRLTTDINGRLRGVTGIAPDRSNVTLQWASGRQETFSVSANDFLNYVR